MKTSLLLVCFLSFMPAEEPAADIQHILEHRFWKKAPDAEQLEKVIFQLRGTEYKRGCVIFINDSFETRGVEDGPVLREIRRQGLLWLACKEWRGKRAFVMDTMKLKKDPTRAQVISEMEKQLALIQRIGKAPFPLETGEALEALGIGKRVQPRK